MFYLGAITCWAGRRLSPIQLILVIQFLVNLLQYAALVWDWQVRLASDTICLISFTDKLAIA